MASPVISWINAVHLDARLRQSAPFKAPRMLIAKATDVKVAITVRESGNARTPLDGAQLVLTACGDKDLSTVLFAVPGDLVDDDGNALDDGDALFSITADDTKDAAIGRAWYSVDVVWPDGRREQLIPPTDAWIVATPPRAPQLGGSARIIDFGVLVFAGETELPVTLSAELAASDYRVVFTPGDSEEGAGAPYCSAEDQAKDGFTAKLSGPFRGPVGWAVYPSSARALPAPTKALQVGAARFSGETEKQVVLAAAVASYRIALSLPRPTDGSSPPFASAVGQADSGFVIRLSGPLTGSVGYAIYAP